MLRQSSILIAATVVAFTIGTGAQGASPSLSDGNSGARVTKAGAKHAPRLVTRAASIRPDRVVSAETGSTTVLRNRAGPATNGGTAYLYKNTGGQGYIALQEAGGLEEQADQIILTLNNPVVEYSVDVYTSSYEGVPWGGTADVYVSLRENWDAGTPGDISDDAPDCKIPGTEAMFTIDLGVITTYTLEVDLGAGITVGDGDNAVWVAVLIDSAPRPPECPGAGLTMPGWRIAEEAEIGDTDDGYVGLFGPWGLGNCFGDYGDPTPCQTPPDPDICYWWFAGDPYAGMNAVLLGESGAVYEVVPIAATGSHTVAGNGIFLESGGQTVQVEVFVAGWGAADPNVEVMAYQATLHCPDYYSAVQGTLTPLDTPTIMWGPEDPYPSFGVGVDKEREDYIFKHVGDFGGCQLSFLCPDMVTPLAFWCGFAAYDSVADDGMPRYVATFSFEVSADAKGTFELGLSPNATLTSLKDQDFLNITPLGVVPALITVETGACCVDPFVYPLGCADDVTIDECDALCGGFRPGSFCCNMDFNGDGIDDRCGCLSDEDCDDGNTCTDDTCDTIACPPCQSEPSHDEQTMCCNPANGVLEPIDDRNPCTVDTCRANGEVDHEPVPSCGATLGCRYLSMTGLSAPDPVALLVTGDPDDPDVSCVSLYVQPDGTLDVNPVFQTPEEWGAVDVHGYEILPGTTYNLYSDDGTTLSDPIEVTTFIWGDVDGDGMVNITDVLFAVQGFVGDFTNAPWQAIDLEPCEPNRFINIGDVLFAVQAFTGSSYEDVGCSAPCP